MVRKLIATPEITQRAIQMRQEYKPWPEIASALGIGMTAITNACRAAGKKDQRIAELLRRIGREMLSRSGQKTKALHDSNRGVPVAHGHRSFLYCPDTETHDQELTGTPPLCRSALNKVETDGRGNISKGDEFRSPLGPIRIPDIRINSSHST